jgi:hypothetical protein
MTGSRPRTRFVPTLTEVVTPGGAAPAIAEVEALTPQAVAVHAAPNRSMLDAAVDDLMPQAREQMRQRLHTAAYELAEEQLRSMEDSLRQQLRNALREAAGMGKKS